MYREHFGLVTSPFGISPRLDFLYRSAAFEESIAHLVYGLENSEAIVMITGAIGTGKTMAIQSFLSHLGSHFVAALVTNTSVDAKELLKLVLDDLEVACPAGADKSDLLIAFKQFLIKCGREGKRVIIVIDESQNLQREVLEEIRLLTNLGQGEEQPVQIVLVGQPELEAAVARSDLAQLRQRIRVHYKLTHLSRRELEEYVDHRMQVAGGQAGIFSAAALGRIYELSDGVPRVVNTLCGDALLAAFVAGRKRVEAEDVGEAAPGWTPAADVDVPAPVLREERPPTPAMAVRREAAAAPPKPEAVPAPAAPAAAPGGRRRGRGADRGRTDRGGSRALPVLVSVLVLAVALALYVTGKWELPFAPRPGSRTGSVMEPATTELSTSPGGDAADRRQPEAALTDTATTPATAQGDTAPPARVAELPSRSAADTATVLRSEPTARPATDLPAERVAAAPGPAVASETTAALPAAGSAAAAATGDWYIHVSSFRTAEQSAAAAAAFPSGGAGTVVREQIVNQTMWYRVYLGPFESHDVAVRRANALRDAGTVTYYKVLRLEAGAGS